MTNTAADGKRERPWLYDLLLILVLLAGTYLRAVGLDWDEGQHLHPDERFLTMVESALQVRVCADPTVPVEVCPPEQKRWLSWGEYFDTGNSPLNPHNRGYGFFVYGTLPIFIVRYSAELMNDLGVWARHVLDTSSAGGLFARPLSALAAANWADYGHVHLIGRQWSALADLGTILLLYLIAARLYNRKVALLAAAFSTLAVLQIQQSHFFTVDTFANFFIYLATYFAVRVALDPWRAAEGKDAPVLPTRRAYLKSLARDPLLWHSVGFGLALGMAVASKLNAAPLAVLLPAAFLSREVVRAVLTGREAESAVSEAWRRAVLYVVTGALVSLIAFRVFQPYAFKGPGFFGLMPNDAWIANIREQRAQASGDVDLPFALQWARRSHLFSFKNLTLWGLGLPLGILAWAGFLGMGWRILKGDRRRHALLWGWTALYFLWQSLQFNPTMRYQLPIYPLLAMMAAWGVFALARWKDGRLKPLAALLGGLVLVLTAAWAFAFTRIYTRPHTRVAASRWIYQNVPGALNLLIRTPEGERYQQPLPFAHGSLIQPGQPFTSDFTIQADGTLEGVSLARPTSRPPGSRGIALSLLAKAPQDGLADTPLAGATYPLAPGARGEAKVPLSAPVALQGQTTYVLSLQVVGEGGQVDLCAPITLPFTVEESEAWDEVVQPPTQCVLGAGGAVQIEFTPQADGTLSEVVFSRLDDVTPPAEAVTLTLSLAKPGSESPLLQVQQRGDFRASETRREPFTLSLPQPLPVRKGEQLRLSLDVDGGSLALSGSAPINESSWDDGLPLRLDGYDGFGGIYQPGLNLELYWDDNAEKLQRFLDTLNQGDYIFISSNRQWGSIPRVPERYPLTIAYYRALLGCPPERDVVWCYNVARPGDFQGELGYDLVAVFESFPSLHIPGLLDWEVNDQFAEEAFTVYDHPKVLIFKKRPDYDPERVAAILGAVDLSRVVHLTPRRAASYKDLMLPPRLLEIQRAGGTWSELFNRDALHNRYPVLGLLLWYLTVFVLGLAAYPLVRLALPGLADGGYPLARSVGMLLLAYLSWLAGSFGVPYHRVTIGVAFGAILLLGAALAWGRREALCAEWRERRGYVLFIEALFLAFFLLDLAIRLGNPDLWHPAKGGERPMDFSYLNAVLKSTVFPPYDPWYAGGYINYYYWGFVLVGTPIKMLGIVPSVAYNFVLPTLFALVGVGAFSIGWNLLAARGREATLHPARSVNLIGGLAASAGMILLGNLGTVRMIYQGLQRLAQPDAHVAQVSVFTHIAWAVQGIVKFAGGALFPYARGDWYWFPSRVIPAPGDVEPITEFPLFTFLYSDLHAHMIVLPLALLAIAWALSALMARGRWADRAAAAWGFALGGLVIGAIRPTNTWDFYTYLPLAALTLGYVVWRYARVEGLRWGIPPEGRRALLALGGMALLAALSLLFYQPYSHWFGQAYGKIALWKGSRTPIWSYLTHWGLFLFVIVSWMTWETRQWMASTPVSALRKLRPYRVLLEGLAGLFVLALIGLAALGVQVSWLVLPLAVWDGVLFLRPGWSERKRFVAFMVGTGLVLTLIVEVIVLAGDIGRMNTVFKLYLQAWTLFAVSAAAALGWLLPELPQWLPSWRSAWRTVGALLLVGASLFTLTGTLDKVSDRMAPEAPHTLDSMTYMAYAQYADQGAMMDLSQDYRAIRWMQENVPGSPVIVEANCPEYRWCTRFTIYTGLPGVVGWNWHQRQQRALFPPNWITDRVTEIGDFYTTSDAEQARAFLEKYDVRYIILGQLERAYYPGEGLEKFEALDGVLWREVYREGETVIYEVIGR